MSSAADRDIDGVLVVDKPVGLSIQDVVARLRTGLHASKAGHGGTLELDASGVVVVLFGKALHAAEEAVAKDKLLRVTARLGRMTETRFARDPAVGEQPLAGIDEGKIQEAAAKMRGDQFLFPAPISVAAIRGARSLVPLPANALDKTTFTHIWRFKALKWEAPLLELEVLHTKTCPAGSLIHEFGSQLGCGACIEAIRRVSCGPFAESEAIPLDDFLANPLTSRLLPMTTALQRIHDCI